jgi:hypothetical protein
VQVVVEPRTKDVGEQLNVTAFEDGVIVSVVKLLVGLKLLSPL